jgi:hypothetical protein
MGSFNVACSVSSISIGCGTKLAFIPLLPSEMNETIGNKYNKFNLRPGYVFLEPSANWVSNEGAYQFYKPLSLPIFAEYNDYGGIENIEDNITSRTLAEYFGISVEEFVDCIGNSRGLYDYYSPIFAAYFSSDKKLVSDYHTNFNEKWLLDLGLTKVDDNFKFKNHKFTVSLFKVEGNEKNNRQAGFGYKITNNSGKVLFNNKDTYDNRERFLENYLDATGHYLGYSEENFDKIKLLSKLSGMFIHREIYDMMAAGTFSEYSSSTDSGSWGNEADLNEDTLVKLGFTLRCEDKSIERYKLVYEYPGVTDYVLHCDGTWSHLSKTSAKNPNGNPKQEHLVQYGVYHPNQLIKAWKELTGIQIQVEESILRESKFGASFDQIRQQYLDFKSGESESDDEREINEINIKRAQVMKESPEGFQAEVDAIKNDEKRFSFFKSFMRMGDDFDFEDDESGDDFEPTDEEIGNYLIKRLEERLRFTGKSPLDEPNGHIYLPLKPSYDKYNMLSTLYEPQVVDGTIKKDVVDFCDFYCNLYAMNKVMMPTANGYQFGCQPATLALARKTMEIMQSEMRDYESEEIEEELA